jgi:hypothetical protein
LGRELTAYVAAGITSTHESVTKRQTLERLRNGMYVYLREGSAWLDIKETIKAYTETGIDPRHICLCTDDKEPESILRDGSVDHCVRRAIEEGVDPLTAIQMATINPAERYRLQYELGSIAPARLADILVVSDLTKFRIEAVFADGELVAERGRMVKELPRFSYPEKFMKSVKLPHTIKPEEFEMRVMGQNIEAARYAGIRLGRTLLTGSLVAGGLAGIGGLVIVSGIIGRLRPGASPGYGYTAIIIAFLSGLNPWLALPASVFFGGLLVAGDVIQSTLNLPFAAVQIFQATIFLMIILGEFFKRYRVRVVR